MLIVKSSLFEDVADETEGLATLKLTDKCSQDLRNERPEVVRWENRLSLKNPSNIQLDRKFGDLLGNHFS